MPRTVKSGQVSKIRRSVRSPRFRYDKYPTSATTWTRAIKLAIPAMPALEEG